MADEDIERLRQHAERLPERSEDEEAERIRLRIREALEEMPAPQLQGIEDLVVGITDPVEPTLLLQGMLMVVEAAARGTEQKEEELTALRRRVADLEAQRGHH